MVYVDVSNVDRQQEKSTWTVHEKNIMNKFLDSFHIDSFSLGTLRLREMKLIRAWFLALVNSTIRYKPHMPGNTWRKKMSRPEIVTGSTKAPA